MMPLVLTLDDILTARREDLTRSLRAGREIQPGSAWIYATGDEDPRPRAMVLGTSELANLIAAAKTDGVFQFGLAAISWTPLITLLERVMWLWIELRSVGGYIYTAQITGEDLGDWRCLFKLPRMAIPSDNMAGREA